ncbi:uncharacterized protein [Nicotiana sylvestris]|uniref:uncharacterized protein n=1 Tax=Nicotiana sylvestris TaxID=4096 RepID=UPI00388C55E0
MDTQHEGSAFNSSPDDEVPNRGGSENSLRRAICCEGDIWSGLGIVLKPPMGGTIRQSIKTSRLINNEADYEAMIAGLELAKSLGAEVIEAKWGSLLVVNQVNKSFDVREDMMQWYLDKLQITLRRFKEWTLDHVPREQNSEADALSNLGSSVEEDDIVPGTVVQL